MQMIELDVQMDNDLIAKARGLAVRYFGDDSDASLAQVLEVAFRMRCLWSRSIRTGQQQTDEAITSWEFAESPGDTENTGSIRNWLFGR